MKEPRAFCCYCHEPIYDNVADDTEVICWKCSSRLAYNIEQLEKESGMEILNTEDYQRALDIIDEKERGYSGDVLKQARQYRKWSQSSLAFKLKISVSYLQKMENGLKPLNTKAVAFIREQENNGYIIKTQPTLRTLKKSERRCADSKQDTGCKNGGLSPSDDMINVLRKGNPDLPLTWDEVNKRT